MPILRAIAQRHSALAFLLVAVALFAKAVVPAGYMVSADTRILSVQICAASTGHALDPVRIAVPVEGAAGKGGGLEARQDCAFGSLSMASLGGADPALLLAAIAFVLALGFAPRQAPPARPALRLRPPLRAPPLPA